LRANNRDQRQANEEAANMTAAPILWLGPAALIFFLLRTCASADPIVPEKEHCVINVRPGDVLNMRDHPRQGAAVVSRKRHDACGIRVNDQCRGQWCPVEDGHSLGWAHRRYLAMVSPARYCVTNVAPGDRLNLRAFPSAQSRIVHSLGEHACGIAFLPYAVGNWQKIRVAGRYGWTNRKYLSGQ
jgi:SH3-like domain-containing protein